MRLREDLWEVLSKYLMQGVEPTGIVRYVICNDFYSLADECKSQEDLEEATKVYKWLQKNGIVDGIRSWGNKAIMFRYCDVVTMPPPRAKY